MDITMIGLQNAGKTSLLRVLAVSHVPALLQVPTTNTGIQGGEFTLEYVLPSNVLRLPASFS